jgi:cation diffusion facilitator CzcD-associated flavoprotein CzcO
MNEVTSEESADQQVSRRRVAIVGSGPGGLVVARYLKHHGFEPMVFEQDDDIGGNGTFALLTVASGLRW